MLGHTHQTWSPAMGVASTQQQFIQDSLKRSTHTMNSSNPDAGPSGAQKHDEDAGGDMALIKAHTVNLRLVLATWIIHFKSLSYIKDNVLKMHDDRACPKAIEATTQNAVVR